MSLVVLDRDGVINHDSADYIKTVDEWRPIDGSLEAIANLQRKGYTIAIATNQSGIGRGYYTEKVMHEMHQKMNRLLVATGGRGIDHIAYCPHLPEAACDCRKPKPGLLDQIAFTTGEKLENAVFVGDSLRDLQAAEARKMKPILVLTGNGVKTSWSLDSNSPIDCYKNLKLYADSL